MALSKAERDQLKRLQDKEKEPDAPAVTKSISATVDLSDPKSIAAAIKHGFLTAAEADKLKDDDDDSDDDDSDNKKKKDATPRRRGYFKEDSQ